MGFWRCTTKTSTMSERKTADKASLRGIYVNWISCSFVAIQCFALIDPIQPRCKSNRSKRKNFNNTNTRKNHKSSWNVYACKQSSFTRNCFNCKLCDFFSFAQWMVHLYMVESRCITTVMAEAYRKKNVTTKGNGLFSSFSFVRTLVPCILHSRSFFVVLLLTKINYKPRRLNVN